MRAKELEAIEYRDAHAKETYMSSFIPEKDYCATCTSLGKTCPNEFPWCQDWKDYEEEEEENGQGKRVNDFSKCSNWDADLGEQHGQKQELEKKEANEEKTFWKKTQFLPVILTFQSPKPFIVWLKKGSEGNQVQETCSGRT